MSKPEIEAVVFDFYDVVHQDPQAAFLRNHGLTRVNGFAKASDQLDTGDLSLEGYYQEYAHHSGLPLELVMAEFRSARLDPDMKALLEELNAKDGIKTGLLSNTCTQETGPVLDRHGLRPLFDEIVISSETGLRKPDPRIFRLMLDQLDVSPEASVFIDDNPHNIDGARSVGMIGLQFTGCRQLVDNLHKLGVDVSMPAPTTTPGTLFVPGRPMTLGAYN